MTQANRGIQGVVENLIEIAHMQRESIDKLTAAQTEGFAKLTVAQTELTHTVTQLGEKIDRLTDRIDTLSQVTNASQVIVAGLVQLAEKQQATVDKLIAKVGG